MRTSTKIKRPKLKVGDKIKITDKEQMVNLMLTLSNCTEKYTNIFEMLFKETKGIFEIGCIPTEGSLTIIPPGKPYSPILIPNVGLGFEKVLVTKQEIRADKLNKLLK